MKYTVEGGMYLFEYDLAVLNEMQDQVKSATEKSKDGKGMMERVKQRRNNTPTAEVSQGDVVELLKKRGIPVHNTGE
jgi:hypothetical protein